MTNLVVKVLINGLGQYGVWWGVGDKATKLGYKRFFKKKQTAEVWAKKLKNKLLKND